jgi:hypothetical protein
MDNAFWWQQKNVLNAIAKIAEESLWRDARYESIVYIRTIMKSGFYGLLLEVSGEFRFDIRAIRALRNLVSERMQRQLGIELTPKRLIVVFHESSKRISQNPAGSLAEEMDRCRGLRQVAHAYPQRQPTTPLLHA